MLSIIQVCECMCVCVHLFLEVVLRGNVHVTMCRCWLQVQADVSVSGRVCTGSIRCKNVVDSCTEGLDYSAFSGRIPARSDQPPLCCVLECSGMFDMPEY